MSTSEIPTTAPNPQEEPSSTSKEAPAKVDDTTTSSSVNSAAQSPVLMNQQPPISQVLKNALFSPKDRMFVVQLEQDLLNFITSNTDSYLLSPMNSYYRLLTHQTAEYYSLGHTLNNAGDAIIVFKNFNVEIQKPQPLASLPMEMLYPQYPMHPPPHQQQQHLGQFIPSGFTPGIPPNAGPQGYRFNVPYGYPPIPLNAQQQHVPTPVTSSQSVNREQSQSQSSSQQQTPNSAQFKLMKRAPKSNDSESEAASKDDISQEVSNEVNDSEEKTVSTKPPQELESERASRESEYQKARERIFQSQEDEEEEEEEEVRDTAQVEKRSPDIPRVIPTPTSQFSPYPITYQQQPQLTPQQQYPQTNPMVPSFMPPPHPGMMNQQLPPNMSMNMPYGYPNGYPAYAPMMFDQNGIPTGGYTMPYYTQAPQSQYAGGGYRKKKFHKHYNNSYNSNHNNTGHHHQQNQNYQNHYNSTNNGNGQKSYGRE